MRYVILSLLFVAGCGDVSTNNAGRSTGSSGADTCNAAAYAGMIGQDAVVSLSIPDPKREYRIGEPVTSDFNAQRVNIKLDDTDVIIGIDCG
ncbi:MAG: I78 family peptidase inhibitor [Sulfitobacter sp.]